MGNAAAFLITGEFLTDTARSLVLDGEPSKAWALIADCLMGDGTETVARGVLEGRLDLAGDSRVGVSVVDAEDSSEYLDQLNYIYAGRWKSKHGWCRPCAKIVAWNRDSGRLAARRLNRGELRVEDLGPGSSMRAFARARAEFYCGKREFFEIVAVDGRQTFVVFESCGEPPFWMVNRNHTAQDAVDDVIRAGRRLEQRGEAVRSIKAFVETIIEVDDVDLSDAAARDLRSMAAEAEEEAEDRARAAEILRIGEEVRAQAGDDTFELVLLDGRTVTVPRAPFVCWAMMRTDPEAAPPWKPVSPSGLKLMNDDPYHSDWMLGAGIDLAESYKDNVNRPAWDEAARIQEALRDRAVDEHCDTPRDVPTGILAALDSLRRSTVRATVIVKGGKVSGTIGEDVAVLPDLSPLRVPEIERAKAVIAETGGPASHLAIVARGQDLTVMRVANAMGIFEPGMRVTLDPQNGAITIDDDE